MSVTRKWSLLASVLVLAILAAGWFLLVSPRRGEAATLRGESVSQEEANARLLQQLSVLKAQQADLPQQRAKLAVMRQQIPSNPALPTLVRSLTAAGRKVGVSIDTMAPAVPVPVVVATPVAPAVTTTTTDTTTEAGTEADAGAAAVPAVPVAPPAPSLFQIPLTLNVTGSYFELEQFINRLEKLKRSYLVTGFTVTAASGAASADDAAAAADGTAAGDLTLALQGRVYLAPPAPAVTAPITPVAPAPAAQ